MNRHVDDALGGYVAARLLALAAPLDPVHEVPAAERAAARLQGSIGFGRERAEAEARRCVLLQRDRVLQQLMVLEAEPALLREVVAGVSTEGLDQVGRPSGRGLLLVSLHYGPFSSVLLLALAAAAARDLLPPVTVLIDTGLDPSLAISEERVVRIGRETLRCPRRDIFWLYDRGTVGPFAERELAARLSAGAALVVFPDGRTLEPATRGALRCSVGREVIAFGRGPSWLARVSGCRVGSVIVRPEGNGHRVVFRLAATVEEALARMFEETVLPDPAPWTGWLRGAPGQPASPTDRRHPGHGS